MLPLLSVFSQLLHVLSLSSGSPDHFLLLILLVIHAPLDHACLLAACVIALISNHSLALLAVPGVLLLDAGFPSAHNQCLRSLNHEFFVEVPVTLDDPGLVCSSPIEGVQGGHATQDQYHGSADSAVVGGKVLCCCGGR